MSKGGGFSMRFVGGWLILLVLALTCAFSDCFGDELVLSNGDRLTGKIIKLEKGVLHFKADAVKKVILIATSQVKSLVTSDQVEVHLGHGEILKGRLVFEKNGQVIIKTSGNRSDVSLAWAAVKKINPPRSTWHGNINLGCFSQSGNTQRNSVSAGVDAVRKTERDRLSLRVLYNYADEDEVLTARNVFGSIKYDWFFTPEVYGYVSEELLSDEFKNIKLRSVTGAGLGWQVIDIKRFSFALEGGAAHVNHDYDIGADQSNVAMRLAAQLKVKLFGSVTLTDTCVWLPSLDGDQYQVRNELSLATSLGAGWSFLLTNIFEYDNDPSPGVKRTDRQWILGLQYTF
jgi:putative salt-induced outer membrane protein YdiY